MVLEWTQQQTDWNTQQGPSGRQQTASISGSPRKRGTTSSGHQRAPQVPPRLAQQGACVGLVWGRVLQGARDGPPAVLVHVSSGLDAFVEPRFAVMEPVHVSALVDLGEGAGGGTTGPVSPHSRRTALWKEDHSKVFSSLPTAPPTVWAGRPFTGYQSKYFLQRWWWQLFLFQSEERDEWWWKKWDHFLYVLISKTGVVADILVKSQMAFSPWTEEQISPLNIFY